MKEFIQAHSTAILFGLAYAAVGAASVLPQPGDPRPLGTKAYEFFYDFVRLLANKAAQKNPKLTSETVTVTPGTVTTTTTPTVTTKGDPK